MFWLPLFDQFLCLAWSTLYFVHYDSGEDNPNIVVLEIKMAWLFFQFNNPVRTKK